MIDPVARGTGPKSFEPFSRTCNALVIAHPGHELRLYQWLVIAKPTVYVLTDGSGANNKPRIRSTTKILENLGCPAGSIYGRLSDLDIYQAMLDGDTRLFIGLAEELAGCFISQQVECIAGDSLEGYSTSHDLCRMVIDTAVEIVRSRTGCDLKNYEYQLTGRPKTGAEDLQPSALWHRLENEVFLEKKVQAHGYLELANEPDILLSKKEPEVFRVECLRPVENHSAGVPMVGKPYYEIYAEERVAEGRYTRVIRYKDHIRPIAESLLETARASRAFAC